MANDKFKKLSELPVVDKLEDGDYVISVVNGQLSLSDNENVGCFISRSMSSEDLNLATKTGLYTISNKSINKPKSIDWGFLLVFTKGNTLLQVAISSSAEDMCRRALWLGKWSEWYD